MVRYFLLVLLIVAPLSPQDRGDRSDLALVGRIKAEAFDNSQVMDTLSYLTDVYGPRLTASPEFREAADWAVKRLQSYGVENARLEKWGPFGRSWSAKQYSVEMLEPRYALLDAVVLAWSDRTNGPVTGDALLAPFGNGRQVNNPRKMEADLNQYMAEWKGKLKGKMVLLSPAREVQPESRAYFSRYSDKDLSDLAAA